MFFPAFFCGAKFGAPAYVIAIITLLLGLSNGWVARTHGLNTRRQAPRASSLTLPGPQAAIAVQVCRTQHAMRRRPTAPTPSQKRSYLTALLFARAATGLTAIEGDLAANFMVVGLVAGLNVGAYLGWLWLLAH